jgi:hypothetical protein
MSHNELLTQIEDDISYYTQIAIAYTHIQDPSNERVVSINEKKIDYSILTGLSAQIYNVGMLDVEIENPNRDDFDNNTNYYKSVQDYTDLCLFKSWYCYIIMECCRNIKGCYKPSKHTKSIPQYISKNEFFMKKLGENLEYIKDYFLYTISYVEFSNRKYYKITLTAVQEYDFSIDNINDIYKKELTRISIFEAKKIIASEQGKTDEIVLIDDEKSNKVIKDKVGRGSGRRSNAVTDESTKKLKLVSK